MKKAMVILWPSFVFGGLGTVLLFALVDPAEFEVGRKAAYTGGFFFLWAVAAGSSWLTCFLDRRDDAAR